MTDGIKAEVSAEAAALLKYYVYVYSHPKARRIIYIGKGKGGQMFAHLYSLEGAEGEVIRNLLKSGTMPNIHILRYGLTEAEASLVAAAAVDLCGKHKLANKLSGAARGYGVIPANEFLATVDAESVKVRHKAVLLDINRLYRFDMTELELYETTRGAWKVGARCEKADYAMAVYHGVVKEVYLIDKWHPAGTLEYCYVDTSKWKQDGRREFEGEEAEDAIRDFYIGRFVGKSGRNPVRYANI